MLTKMHNWKLFIVLLAIITSCSQDYSPRPKGYLRFEFPEKKYVKYSGNLPYSFEYPVYGVIKPDTVRNAEPFWLNIEFFQYKGKIHISYKKIKNNLALLTEDARKLAYKHTIKADAINEIVFKNDTSKVYGILYEIKGNAASSLQFYLTDNSMNFVRGALYFSTQPNFDSLAPVISFFRKDLDHFIKTFRWK
jgi:gliding motility-associated lipoprotein GldD